MADKNIGSLPQIENLADDSLLVAEQQGAAGKITGKQLKDLAQRGVDVFVAQAKASADAAAKSAQDAAASVGQIGDSVTQAQSAAQLAEEAKTQAQAAAGKAAQDAAAEVATQLEGYVTDATAAKDAAQTAKTQTEQAKADALAARTEATNAQAAAEQAKADAQTAKTDAKAAQTAAEQALAGTQAAQQAAETAKAQAQAAQQGAETARTEAQASNATAAEKAAEAAQSAATAQEYSGKPPIVQGGTWWTWNAAEKVYKDTGKRAVLGFDKVYDSVDAMEADKANQPDTTVAIISSGVDDPDNAKLYIKNGENWEYLSDLSGFTGVGVQSIELTNGNHAPGTTDTYTITLTDGRTQTITVYNGADGKGAGDFMASGAVAMTGNLQMGGNRVTNVGAPTADDDAVRKADLTEAIKNVKITTDATPTQGSKNPVESGGVFTALDGKQDKLTIDGTPTASSGNPVSSGGVFSVLSKKQDTITGTQGQVVGFDAQGRPVAQAAPDTGVVSFNGRKGAVVPTADDYGASDIKFADGQTFQQKYDAGQLDGNPGAPGKSAFQSAQENGYTGSEAEFYAALVALKDGPFLPKPTGTAGQVLGFTTDNTVGAVDRKRVEVKLTVSDGQDGQKVYTLDKTYDEILGHINAGRDVVIIAPGAFAGVFYYSRMYVRNALLFDQFFPTLSSQALDSSWTIRGGARCVRISVSPDNACAATVIPNNAANCLFAPGSTGLVATNVQAAITEVNKKTPKATQVTLTAAGWNASAKTQTVTVSGVLADETKQLIMPMPAVASQNAYAAAGIACTAQAANSLTFKCQTVPAEDIVVYVAVQGVA